MGDSKSLYVLWVVCVSCVPLIVFAFFTPEDSLFIDCGGSKALKLDDGRVFEPDSGHRYVGLSPHSHIVVSETGVGDSNDSVLYHSARVFKETSTYTIITKQIGRHWLRLHLHPVENPRYHLKSAVFSVVANGFSLLHGFSFSKLGKMSGLLKEYVIEVGGSSPEKLVLILSPWNGSIAFINGIEVVSMPDGQLPSSAMPVPLGPAVNIPTHVAFETAYRVNMGGPLITPNNDSQFRIWEPDQSFLVNAASARNVTVNPSSIKYLNGVSVEIAPNWVYSTAQEMADANVIDQIFNISWAFEVEPMFPYLIRMHFCDIVSLTLDTLVFNVYINNQSAMESFDISSKTMELSAAYFVDFVANVSAGSNRVLVQVGPPIMRNFPPNAILNGLEIMKMSDPRDSLVGNLSQDYNTPKTNKWVLLAVTFSVGFAVLVLISVAFYLYLRHPKKPRHQTSVWVPLTAHVGNSDSKVSVGSFASAAHSLSLGRVLAFSEICEATKNFDESSVLGVGGFGKVYKGVLECGVVVAVKRGNPQSQQGFTEFRTEIAMLSKLRHRHLVSLIGYCDEFDEMILVYEFMAGGPLRKHLYGSDLPPLTWNQRLQVCIGAAKGLHYLHTGAAESIIHRDVKTTNILLDENLIAKVADFGLSKLGPTLDQTHVSTAVKGSFGYLDPEYFRRQQLTEKSDVYSFGVVLMEVLFARPAINPALPRDQVNIAEWAMNWQKRGQLEKVIDPHLVGSVNLESLRKFGETAEKCLAEHGTERPTMGDVLWNLEYALQLQEASIQMVSAENSANYIPDVPEWVSQIQPAEGDGADTISYQESDTTSNGVFSQLLDPKGR
ncbi:receptor-like protein kinase THESEUS 1 [Juglans microcarpa x Juglans regia]|uniref:receptor-like protein kinase THESEUS 1 n=1 Tax=Juglans microcarpa x Juglans regia TaxID=2249226 RepID=UPI001B7EB311|nr:receptor-like protein kinase THESEUS 1 [Juglans microcarpa x Juglans regia]